MLIIPPWYQESQINSGLSAGNLSNVMAIALIRYLNAKYIPYEFCGKTILSGLGVKIGQRGLV